MMTHKIKGRRIASVPSRFGSTQICSTSVARVFLLLIRRPLIYESSFIEQYLPAAVPHRPNRSLMPLP